METPFFHFGKVSDQLGEAPALVAKHLAEAIQELWVRKMLELPELTVGHEPSIHPDSSSS
jgi:hypothetical protein